MLAIAGLIFLMVFIALPALQRSQRDTQRKDDMARFSTAISNYQSNNRGKVPSASDIEGTASGTTNSSGATTGASKFIKEYIITNAGDSFEDPDGTEYKIDDKGDYASNNKGGSYDWSNEGDRHTIYVYRKAKCGTDGEVAGATGDRNIAFLYALEGGGTYCGTN